MQRHDGVTRSVLVDLRHAAADANRVAVDFTLDGHLIRVVVLIELFNAGAIDGAVYRLAFGRARRLGRAFGAFDGSERSAFRPDETHERSWYRSCPREPERRQAAPHQQAGNQRAVHPGFNAPCRLPVRCGNRYAAMRTRRGLVGDLSSTLFAGSDCHGTMPIDWLKAKPQCDGHELGLIAVGQNS